MGLWMKKGGEFIPVSGGSGGGGPHDHDDYLPLAGGTLTGELEVAGDSNLVVKSYSQRGLVIDRTDNENVPGLVQFLPSYEAGVTTGDIKVDGNSVARFRGDQLVFLSGDLKVGGGTEMRSNARSVRVFTGGTGNVAQIGFTSAGNENPAYGILSGYEVWIQTGTAPDGLTTQLKVGRSGSTFDGNLTVNGTINGTLTFGIADGIDTAEVLDRAETATMPVIDDEGVATTDAESITVNEVVTALLAKVKEQSEQIAALSADIQELKGN